MYLFIYTITPASLITKAFRFTVTHHVHRSFKIIYNICYDYNNFKSYYADFNTTFNINIRSNTIKTFPTSTRKIIQCNSKHKSGVY